jgi:2-phospho-L-lactate guanylyltransferase
VAFAPLFGPGSAEAHLAAGATEVVVPVPTLRQDVDDVADLGRALVLGVGPHTAQAAGRG